MGLLTRPDASIVRIAHWNFENLFDTADNKAKDDSELLPAAVRPLTLRKDGKPSAKIDWTREHLATKLGQIKRRLAGLGNPSILSGVEIENEIVANYVARVAGYRSFLISRSNDGRGVNVALFFNESKGLELIGHYEIKLDGESFSTHPTRSIIEAEFLVNGRHRLFVYVNHWPSQGGPPSARQDAAYELWKRVSQLRNRYPDAQFLATGDFNVIDTEAEKPHAIRWLEEERTETPSFLDVGRHLAEENKLPADAPPGTYFYPKLEQWNYLDRFLISRGMIPSRAKTGLRADFDSFRIVAPRWSTKVYELKDGTKIRVPWASNHRATTPEEAGYSDHHPIVLDLVDMDERR